MESTLYACHAGRTARHSASKRSPPRSTKPQFPKLPDLSEAKEVNKAPLEERPPFNMRISVRDRTRYSHDLLAGKMKWSLQTMEV